MMDAVMSKCLEIKKINALHKEIRSIVEGARSMAYRSINSAMTQAYWEIGRLIVEHEQGGRRRAEYGKAILEELSKRLTDEFGRGYTVTNLRYMRQFYIAFPVSCLSRADSLVTEIHHALRGELSWTHYRLLLKIENPGARKWYMSEAIEQQWSSRQLDRQISTQYYERLLASGNKKIVRYEAKGEINKFKPEQLIRDPYILEFLGLKDYPDLREQTLERAILDNLQSFLLELGKGFSFVARQKRMRLSDEDFYIDLVFYNYLLKCFVLIDLKVGKLTHQDIGQMHAYVRMFEEHCRVGGDNPTIGLILCSQKNEAIAKYSVLSESKQIFASKYVLFLPTETELERELSRERKSIEEDKERSTIKIKEK